MRRALVAILLLAACHSAPARDRLVVAYPASLDTNLPWAGNDSYTASILANVYEPLVDFNADLALVPTLAESWATPDDLTWLFTLRSAVLRHDGRPLTAADVVAGLNRARQDPRSKLRAELQGVASVQAIDERTLRIRTSYPLAPLPNRLASVPIAIDTPAGVVGTGPYRLVSWGAGRDAQLQAFEGYRSLPRVSQVVFRAVPSLEERIAKLGRGEIDLIADIEAGDRGRIAGLKGTRTLARRGLMVEFLAMDCARAKTPYVDAPSNPFRDARVRRAVALALDRRRLIDGPFGGEAELVDQVVGPQVFGFEEGLEPWPHDIEAARGLLAQAGFPRGFFTDLDLLSSDSRGTPRLAEAIAHQLADVGIRLRLRPQPDAALLRRVEARDTSFYLMSWISTSGDFGITADYLLRTPGDNVGLDNGGNYSNAEVDRLLSQAARTPRTVERKELLKRVAVLVHDDVAVVPLLRVTDFYALSERLAFRPRLDRQLRAAEMYWLP